MNVEYLQLGRAEIYIAIMILKSNVTYMATIIPTILKTAESAYTVMMAISN